MYDSYIKSRNHKLGKTFDVCLPETGYLQLCPFSWKEHSCIVLSGWKTIQLHMLRFLHPFLWQTPVLAPFLSYYLQCFRNHPCAGIFMLCWPGGLGGTASSYGRSIFSVWRNFMKFVCVRARATIWMCESEDTLGCLPLPSRKMGKSISCCLLTCECPRVLLSLPPISPQKLWDYRYLSPQLAFSRCWGSQITCSHLYWVFPAAPLRILF